MSESGKVQRANREERLVVKQVLREIWRVAYTDGKYSKEYANTIDGKREAKVLHQSISDHRKEIRRKRGDNLELFTMINECSIYKVSDTCVEVRRKKGKFSGRSQTVLNLIQEFPSLRDDENESEVENVMKNFKKDCTS